MNDWINNREAGDLRRDRAHYDVTWCNYSTRDVSADVPLDINYQGALVDMGLLQYSQITKTKVSDRCLIDLDPRVFALCGALCYATLGSLSLELIWTSFIRLFHLHAPDLQVSSMELSYI